MFDRTIFVYHSFVITNHFRTLNAVFRRRRRRLLKLFFSPPLCKTLHYMLYTCTGHHVRVDSKPRQIIVVYGGRWCMMYRCAHTMNHQSRPNRTHTHARAFYYEVYTYFSEPVQMAFQCGGETVLYTYDKTI